MRIRSNIPRTADVDCPNCGATHLKVALQVDEGGAYYKIDSTPCNQDGCHKRLCSTCSQFRCSDCLLTFCEEHLDVEYSGFKLCSVCARPRAEEYEEACA
jgi:hypothetical protein